MKSGLAVAALVPATLLGAGLKALAFLSPRVRKQHCDVAGLLKSIRNVDSTDGRQSRIARVGAKTEEESSRPDDRFQIRHQELARKDLEEMSPEEMDRDWKLDRYFGNIRLINLDRNTVRLKTVTADLRGVGLPIEAVDRFSAILGEDLPAEIYGRMVDNMSMFLPFLPSHRRKLKKQHKAQTGCYLSHYRMFVEAKERYDRAQDDLRDANEAIAKFQQKEAASGEGNTSTRLVELKRKAAEARKRIVKYSSTLVIEDDNRMGRVLDAKKQEFTLAGAGKVFREAMIELPYDYDMLYFTCLEKGFRNPAYDPTRRIKRLIYAYETNAYAVSAKMYPVILRLLEKIETTGENLRPVDVELAGILGDHECYLITPPIAFQSGDPSDIVQSTVFDGIFSQPNRGQWRKMQPTICE